MKPLDLVTHPARGHGSSSRLGVGGRDREVGRRERPRQHGHRVALGGHVQVDTASGWSPARKNGRPWVWSQCRCAEQDRAAERRRRRAPGQPPQAGARVEHERAARRRPCGERDARGVPAVADELRARERGSIPGPRRVETHLSVVSDYCSSSRRWPWLRLGERVGVELVGAGDATCTASPPAAWPCACRPRARPARRASRPARARPAARRRRRR